MNIRRARENRALIAGFAAACVSLLIFGWLATQVMRGATQEFDAAVRDAVHAWATPWLTWMMIRITYLGSELWLVPMGALVVWRLVQAQRRHAAALFTIAALGGEVLNQLLKLAFGIPRPQEAFFDFPLPVSYSFPSGHALVSACYYGALAAIVTKRGASRRRKVAIWTAAAILSALIGFSRVYLGVHHASDVIAGYAAAIVWVTAVRAGYEYWLGRRRAVLPRA